MRRPIVELLDLVGVPAWMARSTVRVAAWQAVFVASVTVVKSATNALFLARASPQRLPLLYVAVAILVALTTTAIARLLRTHSQATLLRRGTVLSSITIGVLATAVALDVPGATAALYVAGEVFTTALSVLFWGQMSDAFTPRSLKRAVGAVSAAGMVGAMVGGLSISVVASQVGLIAPCLVAALAISLALPLLRVLPSGKKENVGKAGARGGLAFLLSHRFPLVLAALVVLLAATGAVVDFVFRIKVAQNFAEADMAVLFGALNAVVGVAVAGFQLTLTTVLLARLGVFFFAALVPSVLFLISVAALFSPNAFLLLVVLKAVEMAGAFSLYNATITLLYNPIPSEVRGQVRAFVDGAIKKSGAAFSGLILAGLAVAAPQVVDVRLVCILTFSTLALLPVLRHFYLHALDEKLGRRRPRRTYPSIDVADRATRKALKMALCHADPTRVLAALETLGPAGAVPDVELVRLLHHADERVRKAALASIPRHDNPTLTQALLQRVVHEDQRRLRAEAVRALGKTAAKTADTLVADLLNDDDPAAVTAAIEVSLRGKASVLAQERLQELTRDLAHRSPAWRREIARLLGRIAKDQYNDALSVLLKDDEASVRRVAAEAAGMERHQAHVHALILALGDRQLREVARAALTHFQDDAVPVLSQVLDDGSVDLELRVHIPRVLRDIGTQAAGAALLFSNPRDSARLQRRIAVRLLEMKQKNPGLTFDKKRAEQAFRRRLVAWKTYKKACEELEGFQGAQWLYRVLVERRDQNLFIGFTLLGLHRGVDRMLSAWRVLIAGNPDQQVQRDAAVELLDTALQGDPLHDELQAALLRTVRPSSEKAAARRILWLRSSKDPLIRALALRVEVDLAVLDQSQEDGGALPGDDAEITDQDRQHRQGPMTYIEGEDLKDVIIDRVFTLEHADLFDGLAADDLVTIASICEEVELAAGEMVYEEGEEGGALFVIIDGRLNVLRGQEVITSYVAGESVGQVSFLDRGPRPLSAQVWANGPARLLQIERGALMDLFSDRPGLMLSFFTVLGRRLRQLIEEAAR